MIVLLRMHLRALARTLQIGVLLGGAFSWMSRNATSFGRDVPGTAYGPAIPALALLVLLVVLAHVIDDRLARGTTAGTMRYCCQLPVRRRAVFFAPHVAGSLAVLALGAFVFVCETTGLAYYAIELLHDVLPRELQHPKRITTLDATARTFVTFVGWPLFTYWFGAWAWQRWCTSARGRRVPTDAPLARLVSFATLPAGGALLVLLVHAGRRLAPTFDADGAALALAAGLAFAVLRRANRLVPDDFPRGGDA